MRHRWFRGLVIRTLQAAWSSARAVAARVRGPKTRPEPWNSTVLDDIADNRPWNLVCKGARLVALLRLRRLEDGVTVVVVNWNTLPILRDVLDDVRRFSPADTRLLVVDNASEDGSREYLRSLSNIETVFLPVNVGHSIALDLATYRARTKVLVTLDSDAFPLCDRWLDPAVEPVRTGKAVLAGLRSSRDFVHPVFLAVDVEAFVLRRLSFQLYSLPSAEAEGPRWGENCWDCAELMTGRLRPDEVSFVEVTPNRAQGLPGMSAGDVVYHHGGVTRATTGGVSDAAVAEWRAARAALLESG